MLKTTLNPLDLYNFRARLQPSFIALLPLAFGVFAWSPPGTKWVTALWSLLSAAGFTFLLANFSRNLGKDLEPKLWEAWGGAPTTQLLRHRGPGNPMLRARWHKVLSKLLGSSLPTVAEEQADPAQADAVYEAATRLLIGKTRDKKTFGFIYRDLVNYGFCRNLLGLRWVGVATSVAGLVLSVWAIWRGFKLNPPDYLPWACAGLSLLFLLGWLLVVKTSWVKPTAMNYAQHLFEATEWLASRRKRASAEASQDEIQRR